MKSITLDKLIETRFQLLENIEEKKIICEIGVFNYILMKYKNANEFLKNKSLFLYNEQFFKERIKGEEKLINDQKIISIKNYCNKFNLETDLDLNVFIYPNKEKIDNQLVKENSLFIYS